MGKGGFSWKRATGITKAKTKISRATGIPLTKSGRQRKVGKMVTGKGCLVVLMGMISMPVFLIWLIIHLSYHTS